MKVYPYPQAYPHQIRDPKLVLSDLKKVSNINDQLGFDGILLFTALTHSYDHWDLAHYVAQNSNQIPMIAMPPLYEHPVITARKIVTFQMLYKRPIAINWITGIAKRDYEKLDLFLTKQERYERLYEYISIVNHLLYGYELNQEKFKTYKIKSHKMPRGLEHELFQYISGSSEFASVLLNDLSYLTQIAPAMDINHLYSTTPKALGLGVIIRESIFDADLVYKKHFSEDKLSKNYYRLAKVNTDSTWKKDLFKKEDEQDSQKEFRYSALKKYSEVGFLVTDYRGAKTYFQRLKNLGCKTILACSLEEEDLHGLKKTLESI